MKTIVCCLVLGVVPAVSPLRGGSPAAFGVYSVFEYSPPKPVQDSLEREFASVMSPVGMRFEWKALSEPRLGDVFAGVAVVNFKGTCDLSGSAERFEAGSLASTNVTDGHVLPFAEVDCDRIHAFVAPALNPMTPQDQVVAFGRAIGRVVAHEFYHIVTQTKHHGSSGVGKAIYSLPELMADDFAFESADVRALTTILVAKYASSPGEKEAIVGRSLFSASGCTRCHSPQGNGSVLGPRLQGAGQSWNVKDVSTRLKGKSSEMYRRARDLGIRWPSLAKSDIESLVQFLNSPPK